MRPITLALLASAAVATADDPIPRVPLQQPEAYLTIAEPEALQPAQALEPVPAPVQLPAPPAEAPHNATLSRPIGALTLDAAADPGLLMQMPKIPDSFAIKDAAIDRFGDWDAPRPEATLAPPRFAPTAKHFAAPAVYSRPLYFEQPNVERYGHHVRLCPRDNLSQSALSAAHFFATVPVLPYLMGAEPADECSYVLGAYRPGSCNPHQLHKPRLSLDGAVLQGAAVTGLVFLIP